MDNKLLEEIGFTKSETAVYKALLEIGQNTTGPIIERSGITSSKIYEVLNKLIKKGLVSYVNIGKIKYYEAAPPRRILDYIKAKEEKIFKQKEEIKSMISKFEKKSKTLKEQSAAIYRGFKGMKIAFDEALDLMKKGEIVYVTNVFKIKPEEDIFFKHWNEHRAKKGVKLKMILEKKASGQLQANSETNPLSELRWLPKNMPAPAPINIYKDRVILFVRDDNDKPLLIIIWSKAVVDSFKLQFDLQWKTAKPFKKSFTNQ